MSGESAPFAVRATNAAPLPQCPEHGDTMRLRQGRTGKFYGCSHYPSCRHTVPVGLPGVSCPACGGPVVERIAKKSGKPFWPCGARGCEFVSWTKPHPCKACGAACFGAERERVRLEPDAVPDPAIPERGDHDDMPF
jgi:DNA topoisomerase-1